MSNEDRTGGIGIKPARLIVAGLGAALIGLGAWYFTAAGPTGNVPKTTSTNAQSTETGELMKLGPLEENILGKLDAPVTVIEYSSMTCPHCASFHNNVLPGLKKKYVDTGKMRFIVREFPLDNLAAAASMLARCADKSRFFPFVDALFAQQAKWSRVEGDPVPALFNMSKQAGFTREKFDSCLRDQKLLDGINWVRERANKKFGVNSTPTFFVNGKLLKRGSSVEDFEALMPADIVTAATE